MAVVAAAYYASGVLGHGVRLPPAGIAVTWPPNAIVLAALLLSPPRLWPWYLLVLLPTHAHQTAVFQPAVPPLTMLMQFAGNAGQALLAAVVLHWIGEAPPRFDTLRGCVAFLIACVVAVTIASSGVIYLFTLSGWVVDYWPAWSQRVLSNVITTATLTPAIVLAFTSGLAPLRRFSRRRSIELGTLLFATFTVASVFFSIAHARDVPGMLLFAPLPLLLWAAVRFPPLCLFVCLHIVMLTLLLNAHFGRAPLLALPAASSVLALQIFLVAISIPTILLMAMIQERDRTERALIESRRRYGMATAAGAISVWEWDLRTGDFYLEPSLKAWLGFAGHEIQTLDDWVRHLHPEENERVRACLREYLTGLVPIFETEHRVLDRDGSVRWLLCRGAATEWAHGEIVRIVGTSTDVTDRKRAEQELRQSSERIRELAGRLMSAQEEERRRIARDLHDDLNQKLAALALGLSILRSKLPASAYPVLTEIELLQNRTNELVSHVRRLSHELHPTALEHAGLVPALRTLASELKRLDAFDLKLTVTRVDRSIPLDVALGLFRIAQEAVRNAVRHSGSDKAALVLTVDDDQATMLVRDYGRGFDAERANDGEGLGLVSIRERVNLLRGRLDVSSRRGQGVALSVSVPLAAEAAAVSECESIGAR